MEEGDRARLGGNEGAREGASEGRNEWNGQMAVGAAAAKAAAAAAAETCQGASSLVPDRVDVVVVADRDECQPVDVWAGHRVFPVPRNGPSDEQSGQGAIAGSVRTMAAPFCCALSSGDSEGFEGASMDGSDEWFHSNGSGTVFLTRIVGDLSFKPPSFFALRGLNRSRTFSL